MSLVSHSSVLFRGAMCLSACGANVQCMQHKQGPSLQLAVSEPVLFVCMAPCHCKAMYVSESDRNEGTDNASCVVYRCRQNILWHGFPGLQMVFSAGVLPDEPCSGYQSF